MPAFSAISLAARFSFRCGILPFEVVAVISRKMIVRAEVELDPRHPRSSDQAFAGGGSGGGDSGGGTQTLIQVVLVVVVVEVLLTVPCAFLAEDH